MTERFEAIGDQVRAAMERLGVPGVALGVLHAGATETAGFGVTSVPNPLAVDAGTLFRIGSISKTFTATAVMRLVEAGRLDLDAPLRTYMPELRMAGAGVAERVTLRHSLNHYGGWVGDVFDDFGGGDDGLVLAEHRRTSPLDTQPPPPEPPPVRLAFFDADRVIGLDPPFEGARAEFLRDERERITWFRWNGRIHRRR